MSDTQDETCSYETCNREAVKMAVGGPLCEKHKKPGVGT
jgi:hypothetical protein